MTKLSEKLMKYAQLTPSQRSEFGLKSLAGGAAAGFTTAALLNLISYIRSVKSEEEDERKRLDANKDTITLTLPPSILKKSEVDISVKPPKLESPEITEKPMTYSKLKHKQTRDYRGKFGDGIKTAQETVAARPQGYDIMLSALLGLAGLKGGYALSNSIYDRYRKKQLESEIEDAKQEYLDKLIGSVSKSAEELNEYTGNIGIKEAQQKPITKYDPHTLDFVTSSYLLGLLGIAGGSSYLIKRMLDIQNKKLMEDKETWKPPKLTRVLFRTAPMAEEEEESLTDKAAFAIVLDRVSAKPMLDNSDIVKEAAEISNVDLTALLKTADTDNSISCFKPFLDSNPELAAVITEESFKTHIPKLAGFIESITPKFIKRRLVNRKLKKLEEDPDFRRQFLTDKSYEHPMGSLYRGASKIPGLNYTVDSVANELAKVEGKKQIGDITDKVPMPKYKGIGNIDLKKLDKDTPGSWKQLKKNAGLTTALLYPAGSYAARTMAEEPAINKETDKPNDPPARRKEIEHILSRLNIMAGDAKAKQYILDHRNEIMEALYDALEQSPGIGKGK